MIAYIVRFLQIPPSYFNGVFAVWTKFSILLKGSFYCSVYYKKTRTFFLINIRVQESVFKSSTKCNNYARKVPLIEN